MSIKVNADTKKELEIIASKYGLATSTLGAFIVGEWLEKHRQEERGPSVASAVNYGPGVPE